MYENIERSIIDHQVTSNKPRRQEPSLSCFKDNRKSNTIQQSQITLLQHSNVVQRDKIPIDDLLDFLRRVTFSPKLRICLAEERMLIHGQKPLEYIQNRLLWLHSNWGEHPSELDHQYNALLISGAVDAVGELIAYSPEIMLPRLRPQLTEALLLGYRENLVPSICNDETIVFAASLNHRDPIELYIKQVLSLKASTKMVCEMAKVPGLDSIAFFDLLLLQFKSRINAFDPDLIGANEIPNVKGDANYSPKDRVGFISQQFLNYAKGGKGYKADGYELTKKMDDSIAELRKEVEKTASSPTPDIQKKNTYPNSIEYICKCLKCSVNTAKALLPKINDYILDCPIQVSIWAKDWFDESGLCTVPQYKSMLEMMHKKVPLSELIAPDMEGDIQILNMGDPKLTKGRGNYYPSWRWDKDTHAEDNDLEFSKFPQHGALCFWDSSTLSFGGPNIYGDIHLRLLPNFARDNHVSYKPHATGKLCANPLELFEELVISDLSCYAAILLGSILGYPIKAKPTTYLEVIIPNSFNIQDSVQEILTPHSFPCVGLRSWSSRVPIDLKEAPGNLSDLLMEEGENAGGYQEMLLDQELSKYVNPVIETIFQILQHNAWKKQRIIGVPDGIKMMRNIHNSQDLKYLEQLKFIANKRLAESASTNRTKLTGDFYTLLSQITITNLKTTIINLNTFFTQLG